MGNSAGNMNTIKSNNRALIFRCIRKQPISRAEIAKTTGMSKSAVTMIANQLIEDGQICEIGRSESAMGRKPILLDIVPDYRFAAGIALHRKSISVCLTNLKSGIYGFERRKTSQFRSAQEVLDWACARIQSLASEKKLSMKQCIGIGVSAPGPLDYLNGTILTPPDFELFHNINVSSYLTKQFHLPVMLENNAALLAMQEYFCQQRHASEHYMYIIVSDGIGSAIMSNGSILRGQHGFTGEIGHVSVDVRGLPCSCGNRGCLEQYISRSALKSRFSFDTYESVVDDAYLGDPNALAILDYIADYFSAAIVNAVNLHDLDMVIIHGEFSYRNELLCKKLNDNVNSRSLILRNHPIEIKFSQITKPEITASVTAAVIDAYFEQKL